MTNIVNFTRHTIEEIPIPAKNRIEYRDKKIPELCLRVTPKGVKSYSVLKRVNGGTRKLVRVTIGKYPALSPSQARQLASKTLGHLATGVNPREKLEHARLSNITLEQAFNTYIASKKLKPNTLNDYHSLMRCHLSYLANKKLRLITSTDISRLHTHCSKTSKARADYAFRLLSAIYNFVNMESFLTDGRPIFLENPVKVISGRKQWNKVGRKQGHIRKSELARFAQALKVIRENETETGQSVCDAMLFALLTGLRKMEILNLKWNDINRKGRYFTVLDTKNGSNLELPITEYIANILDCRRTCLKTDYVFSAENSYGQIRTPRKIVQKVKKLSNTSCDFHDLRRTFATTAEHLDVGTYKLKRLMNHATNRNDVTAGYVILTSETLMNPAERIQIEIIENLQMDS
jgi:integrase